MIMKSVWDSRMWIRMDLQPAIIHNSKFLNDLTNKSHLISQLLLYDRVFIPTKDFGIVPILIEWFGMGELKELLIEKAIAFVWHEHLHGYMKGGGPSLFTIEKPGDYWENWRQEVRWGGLVRAAELQVNHSFPSLTIEEKEILSAYVIKATHRAENYDSSEETVQDFKLNNKLNKSLHTLEKSKGKPVDIKRLSGIKDGTYRVLSANHINNSVDLVLRVAEMNYELANSSTLPNCDLAISKGVVGLVGNKLTRLGFDINKIEKFVSVLNLEKVPDIRPGIEQGTLSISPILKLRRNLNSEKFRIWLHNTKSVTAREFEQAYMESISPLISPSTPKRLFQMVVTGAAGALDTSAGGVVGAVENLYLNRLLAGYSPKYFIEDLRSLPIKDSVA
jgi:hypothetical protein